MLSTIKRITAADLAVCVSRVTFERIFFHGRPISTLFAVPSEVSLRRLLQTFSFPWQRCLPRTYTSRYHSASCGMIGINETCHIGQRPRYILSDILRFDSVSAIVIVNIVLVHVLSNQTNRINY